MRGQQIVASLLVLSIVVFVAIIADKDRPAPASPSIVAAQPTAQQPTATATLAPTPKKAASTTKASTVTQTSTNPELSGPTTWSGLFWMIVIIMGPVVVLYAYYAIWRERPAWWIHYRYGVRK